MKKYIVSLKLLMFLALGTVLVAYGIIPPVLQSAPFHHFLEKQISRNLPFQVRIETISWQPFKPLWILGNTLIQWKSEDQLKVIDNFGVHFSIHMHWPQKNELPVEIRSKIDGGEIVWNTFYGNFKNKTFRIESKFSMPFSLKNIALENGSLFLEDQKILSFQGEFSHVEKISVNLDVQSNISDISKVYPLLQTCIGETYPL